MEYGYCRISTKSQNIDRQERNILAAYPNATIVKEIFTGTTFQGRERMERAFAGCGNELFCNFPKENTVFQYF